MQYGAPRDDCPICLDERQYVGWDGQQWTTLAELASAGHRGRIDEEGPGVIGIGAEPRHRDRPAGTAGHARPAGNVLWDMITYLDDELIRQVRELGGVSAIAISHPHFYGSMIECAHAFGAPVYIHANDREWVARPDPAVEFWDGDTRQIGDGLTLINLGVHFDGGQVLHWADGEGGRWRADVRRHRHGGARTGAGSASCTATPTSSRSVRHVIRRALSLLEPYPFERVYGAWWRRVVAADGTAAVQRSAERYLRFAGTDPASGSWVNVARTDRLSRLRSPGASSAPRGQGRFPMRRIMIAAAAAAIGTSLAACGSSELRRQLGRFAARPRGRHLREGVDQQAAVPPGRADRGDRQAGLPALVQSATTRPTARATRARSPTRSPSNSASATSQVKWVYEPFNNSYAPGPKKFDFDINEISAPRSGRRRSRSRTATTTCSRRWWR